MLVLCVLLRHLAHGFLEASIPETVPWNRHKILYISCENVQNSEIVALHTHPGLSSIAVSQYFVPLMTSTRYPFPTNTGNHIETSGHG